MQRRSPTRPARVEAGTARRTSTEPRSLAVDSPRASTVKISALLAAASLLTATAVACSPNSGLDGSGGLGNSGGAGNGNGNSGTANGQPSGNGGASDGPSAGTFAGVGGNGTGVGVGGGCAGTSVQAEKLPLDMYIMLDQSGSMTDPVTTGGDKWDNVTAAIKSFVQQPQSAGLGVGIQFFGLMDSNFDDSCDAAQYANPLTPTDPEDPNEKGVEIATLPGVANAIIAAIGSHSPQTLTPTSAALQGAVDHAKAWQIAHPTHVVVAVLATDGDPTECETDLSQVDAIASTAANGTPKIRTFVIGIGDSIDALNGIASAGGTGQAYIASTNANTNTQFLAALNAIQGTALACSYLVPTPPNNEQPDYTAVNVEYTPGNGMPTVIIPNVPDAAHCPATGNGWYYDNPAAPTQIILCGATCDTVKVDTTGNIHVVLGCKTVPA